MKLIPLSAALAALSIAQVTDAQSYQVEVDGLYTQVKDRSTEIDLYGSVVDLYFEPVATQGHLLAEAYFLEHASHIGAAYLHSSSESLDSDTLAANLSYFVPNTGIYIAASYSQYSNDFADENNWTAQLGFLPMANCLVYTNYDDDTDYQFNLNTKYVNEFNDGRGINVEAGIQKLDEAYSDDDFGYVIGADYYFNPRFSLGAQYADRQQTHYGLRGRLFVTPTFSLAGIYETEDDTDYDAYRLEAAVRF